MFAPDYLNILLDVTREDIDNGIRHNGANCPIGLAVKRECRKLIGEPDSVEVGSSIDVWIDGHYYYLDRINDKINEFTTRFDAEDYVAPFQLAIRLDLDSPEYEDDADING